MLRTWMAHHQGMSLLAIDNVLNGSPMQERFHADPRIQAANLLLQERVPQLVPLKNPPAETAAHVPFVRRAAAPPVRLYTTPHTLSPRCAPAVERLVHGDGDQRRRRVQPSSTARADPLARGHHERRVGQLRVRPRSRHRRCLVDDAPALGARGRGIRGDVLARPRRLSPPRRGPRNTHRESSSRRKTTPSCGACRSPTTVIGRAASI